MSDKAMAIDLASFEDMAARQNEGFAVDIKGPDGKKIGLSIIVAGPDSARAQEANEALLDEEIAAGASGPTTAKALRERGVRFLAKVTIGWLPNVILGGEELECTEANALKVYQKLNFIRLQVDAAAGNRANFSKG